MSERRALVEGLKTKAPPSPAEQAFVFGGKPETADPVTVARRAPLTTRLRADLAEALKRASLERQLAGMTPHTVQEIVEEALEPWLRQHGYLR